VESTKLVARTPAPDFTLPRADGGELTLSQLRGQKVILYFYPAAMTPGCTKQACDFQGNESIIAESGYVVVGVSPDPIAKLKEFASAEALTFPLLSDPDRHVHALYGAYGEKQLYGKTVIGVIRSTFLINEEGVIAEALYGVKASGHVERLLRTLHIT
jgi:thioredoxin-dependent peroxiredoxin